MTTRAMIYARVSTLGNGQFPEMQLRELREYCERRRWQIAGEYTDVGISGARDKRPQLDHMMADAHKRRFDVVAVWKFDRFAKAGPQQSGEASCSSVAFLQARAFLESRTRQIATSYNEAAGQVRRLFAC
jgi:DNA invertase Pin-like site-specific DNA recombinase